MVKLRVTKLYKLEVCFEMYVVNFIREAGQTKAITITEDGSISNYDIEDLKIDFYGAVY